MAAALTRIHIRFDEWLHRPDERMYDEPVLNVLCALSLAMKSLLLDIARIRGGDWPQ